MTVDLEVQIEKLLNQGKTRKEIVDELEGLACKTSIYNYFKRIECGRKIEKRQSPEPLDRYEENIRSQANKRLRERKIRESLNLWDEVTVARMEHAGTKNLVRVIKKGKLIQKTETHCVLKMKNYVESFGWEDVVL